jgi:hypothetical protein
MVENDRFVVLMLHWRTFNQINVVFFSINPVSLRVGAGANYYYYYYFFQGVSVHDDNVLKRKTIEAED